MDVAKKETKVLAVDFGASSGRVMLGTYDGNKITVEEIHRFSNDPVIVNGTMYWDVLRLFHEIKQGLIKAKACGSVDSIGVDTWGVDFGLLEKKVICWRIRCIIVTAGRKVLWKKVLL